MIKQIIDKLHDTFKNFDNKIVKILTYGLKFCFSVCILSITILCTYLFFIHNIYIYEIGILIFQLSLYFGVEFIASAITVDTISKQLG